jgi:hypothetical protein
MFESKYKFFIFFITIDYFVKPCLNPKSDPPATLIWVATSVWGPLVYRFEEGQ